MSQENDLLTDCPVVRIIGTETECNLQMPESMELIDYLNDESLKNAGFTSIYGFLDNGFMVYQDDEHIEICTPESLGPRQAAATDMAGILVVSKIVEASGIPHNGLYRQSGTIKNDVFRTSGYHENYLIHEETVNEVLYSPLIASHLASRIYGFCGTVGMYGFQLSQKIKGIGGIPVSRDMSRRTTHGDKPMAMLPTSDTDTIGDNKWGRLEVRFADPGFSPTAKYLSLASTSLVLRLIEHSGKVNMDNLNKSSFKAPLNAAKLINRDLTFKTTHETRDGKKITALDYQEILANAANELSEVMLLPDDEIDAIELWLKICDELRASDMPNNEYGELMQLVDFAPRHRFISTKCKPEEVNSGNMRTVGINLLWDRILPSGGGMLYWNKIGSEYINQDEILDLVYTPPASRAELRSMYISNFTDSINTINWAKVTMNSGSNLQMPPNFRL